MCIDACSGNRCRKVFEKGLITVDNKEWSAMSPEEKKYQLFLNQKNTLDLFLERKAISQAQYDKSLGDLREKMGIPQ